MGGVILAAMLAAAPVTITADRPFIVAASRESVAVTVTVAGIAAGDPDPVLRTSVGTLSEVKRTATGLRAVLAPPGTRFPQVALLRAEASSGGAARSGWLALPVHGQDTLKLRTKPNARVEVRIGESKHGPMTADKTGRTAMPVIVPPGIRFATARSVDRVKNVTEKPIDLEPPPFALVGIASLGTNGTGIPVDAERVELELFGIDASGAPATGAVELAIDRGSVVSDPEPVSGQPGVFRAAIRPPDAPGKATVQAWPKAEGRKFAGTLPLELVAGAPVRLEVTVDPAEIVAGAKTAAMVRVRQYDAKGNETRAGAVAFETELGRVDERGRLEVPDAFGGRGELEVRARAGKADGAARVRLIPGPPARGEVVAASDSVRAGGSDATVTVALVDAFGNPVPKANVEAKADRGEVDDVNEVGGGRYELVYSVARDEAPGPARIEARAAGSEVAIYRPITILPYQASWGLSAGLLFVAHSNLGAANGGGPWLELAVRPGKLPVEVIVQGGASVYGASSAGGVESATTFDLSDGRTYAGVAGLRWNRELGARLAAHVSAAAGYHRSAVTVAPSALRNSGVRVAPQQWAGFVARGAGGVSYRLGRGRFLAEAQWLHLPAATARLEGNLGGPSVGVGYLFEVR